MVYDFELPAMDIQMFIAKEWLKTCVESHTNCAPSPPAAFGNFMPTRLLSICDESHIKLVPSNALPSIIKYATLSHCWGSDPTLLLQLESSNIHSFEDRINTALLQDL